MSVLFRCDATRTTGYGHLGRCIALAEALRALGEESAFAGDFNDGAKEMAAKAGFSVSAGAEAGADLCMVDRYGIDAADLERLGAGARHLGVIDDFRALDAYPVDLVLNFTWSAAGYDYGARARTLLGPAYFPARRAMAEVRGESIERDRSGEVRRLLVAIGGSDPKRLAARVSRLLGAGPGLVLRVLSAADAEIDTAVAAFAEGSARVHALPSLAEELLAADAVVAGGGLIKYEAAYMGVPVATLAQNDGQAAETASLVAEGLVHDLGAADAVSDAALAASLDRFLASHEERGEMASRAAALFPPDPALNAARAMLELTRTGT